MRLLVDKLSFSYSGRPVLEEISFEVENEMAAVVGPNGSGKTTLLKCLGGMLNGRGDIWIEIDGGKLNLRRLSKRMIARLVSFLPQDCEERMPLRSLEVVLIGRYPHKGFGLKPGDEEIEAAMEALRMVKAEHLAMRRFDELSGGERQKVRIARALAQQPRLMLLDEPLNNLDLRHQIEVISLLRRLKSERRLSIILVLHDLNFASFADKLLMLRGGRLIGSGPPQQLLTPDTIAQLFDVEVDMAEVGGRRFIIPIAHIVAECGGDLETSSHS